MPHAPVLRVGLLVRAMPKGLKRYYGRGHLHFLTFSCHRRLPLLGAVQARNLFVDVLEKMRERHRFLLVGYVVMPDHVHLLIREPARGTPSTVLQALKQRVSRDLRRMNARTPGAKTAPGAPHPKLCGVWLLQEGKKAHSHGDSGSLGTPFS